VRDVLRREPAKIERARTNLRSPRRRTGPPRAKSAPPQPGASEVGQHGAGSDSATSVVEQRQGQRRLER
jgi:hypothetical protein